MIPLFRFIFNLTRMSGMYPFSIRINKLTSAHTPYFTKYTIAWFILCQCVYGGLIYTYVLLDRKPEGINFDVFFRGTTALIVSLFVVGFVNNFMGLFNRRKICKTFEDLTLIDQVLSNHGEKIAYKSHFRRIISHTLIALAVETFLATFTCYNLRRLKENYKVEISYWNMVQYVLANESYANIGRIYLFMLLSMYVRVTHMNDLIR